MIFFTNYQTEMNNYSVSFEISCHDEKKICEVWNIQKETYDPILIQYAFAYEVLILIIRDFPVFSNFYTMLFNKLDVFESSINTPSTPPPIS